MEQLTIFDMIPDPPKADGVTVRIKWADRRDPSKRGTVKFVTTQKDLNSAVRKWREEHKNLYFLGLTEE